MAQTGPFGTPFLTPKSPEKVYVYVPLLRSFPENEAHNFFSGGPTWGALGRVQKVYVEKVYVLFLSLSVVSPHLPGEIFSVNFCRFPSFLVNFSRFSLAFSQA